MVLPIAPIVTLAACGSLLTAVKSGWELTQLLKEKEVEKQFRRDAQYARDDLRELCGNGVLTKDDFKLWYNKLLSALATEDGIQPCSREDPSCAMTNAR